MKLEELYYKLDYFSDIQLPIDNANSSVPYKLNKIYSDYKNHLSILGIFTLEDMSKINNLCNALIDIVKYYNDEKYTTYKQSLFNALNEFKEKFSFSYFANTNFYRVSNIAPEREYTCETMLHIPYHLRDRAKACRFSIPAIPCTYMSSDISLAWHECGELESLYLASYNVIDAEKYVLLDIDMPCLITFQNLKLAICKFTNNNIGSEQKIISDISHACINLILTIATSFIAKNKNDKIIEEYVIPQILMEWIQLQDRIIGIRYKSANAYEGVAAYAGFNIAIPARSYDENGYCRLLKKIFINDYFSIKKITQVKNEIDLY